MTFCLRSRRSSLILYKALYAFTLLLTSLSLCPSAHAGSWQFSCTGSGSKSGTWSDKYGNHPSSPTAWAPPASSAGTSYQIPSFGFAANPPGALSSVAQNTSRSQTVNITATITITWVADTTLPSDPAPPSVMLIESSSASWTAQYEDGTPGIYYGSGAASDGLSPADPAVPNYYGGVQNGGTSSSATDANISVPPPHYITVSANGGVVTLSRTFSASAAASLPNDGSQGAMNIGCSFGGYTVQIHAQPYNFHKVPGQGSVNLDGSLKFVYDWSSTTGSKDNLSSCFWHERVTYQGAVGTAAQPNKYYPPDPPFDFPNGVRWLNNPEVGPGTGNQGGAMTGSNTVTDNQLVPPLVNPSLYASGTYTGTQVFQFDDTNTYQTDVQIPGPDSGPFSIVRNFTLFDAHDYQYTITKDGHTSSVLKSF